MFNIDAYDHIAWQAHQDSRTDLNAALKEAARLAQVWPNVEIRNGEGTILASWVDGSYVR